MLESLMMGKIGGSVGPEASKLGGGYYVGKIDVNGVIYALILSPKEKGESPVTLKWKTSRTATTGALSKNDGLLNTQTLINAGGPAHPAANFCHNLVIDGHDDWYLPSMDELEMCYRAFKPNSTSNDLSGSFSNNGKAGYNPSSVPIGGVYTATNPEQTIYTDFQLGGIEAFSTVYYWTSTSYDSSRSRGQSLSNGFQTIIFKDSTTIRTRAVRRQPI